MSRVFSFRDLKLIPEFANKTEREMVRLECDDLMNEALSQLGFSLRAPILYVPSLHRDLQGRVAIGYRAVGQVNEDPAYLNSPLCPLIERLIVAARRDPSLASELARMIGGGVNLDDDYAAEPVKEIEDEYVEPDWQRNERYIRELTDFRDMVRGSPYNEAGSLKLPSEYVKGRA